MFAAYGVGSTRGAIGEVHVDQFYSFSDILPSYDPDFPDSELTALPVAPEGTVQRFMNTADVHATPIGQGARVLLAATITLL